MVLEDLRNFFSKQRINYKLVLIRRSGYSLFHTLTVDYINVYIRLLGASFIQIGLIGSIGVFVNALISYPFGWLIDRYSVRRILIVAILAQALVPLTYFYASDWVWITIATALSTLALFCTRGVEDVIIANSLKREDRATGFTFITGISLIPTIIVPLLSGVTLTYFGGLSVENINILFLAEFVGLILISVYVGFRLQDEEQVSRKSGESFLGELRSILSNSPYLKRWLLIDTMSASSFAVMMRYIMVYATEEKGATPMILGSMAAASAFVSILSSVHLGNLADRIGRIRMVVLLRPLFHVSTLILLFTPDPRWIVLGWALRGTFQPSLSILTAYRNELVAPEERGRWMGVRELLRGIFRIPAPILGGLLYTHVSPMAPFLFHMLVDSFIRVPLLLTMPQTKNNGD